MAIVFNLVEIESLQCDVSRNDGTTIAGGPICRVVCHGYPQDDSTIDFLWGWVEPTKGVPSFDANDNR